MESGYSTQNRDERDKERPGTEPASQEKKEKDKTNKTEQDQIQYIEGEGCQVWRPQVITCYIYYSGIHEFLVDSFIIDHFE